MYISDHYGLRNGRYGVQELSTEGYGVSGLPRMDKRGCRTNCVIMAHCELTVAFLGDGGSFHCKHDRASSILNMYLIPSKVVVILFE